MREFEGKTPDWLTPQSVALNSYFAEVDDSLECSNSDKSNAEGYKKPPEAFEEKLLLNLEKDSSNFVNQARGSAFLRNCRTIPASHNSNTRYCTPLLKNPTPATHRNTVCHKRPIVNHAHRRSNE